MCDPGKIIRLDSSIQIRNERPIASDGQGKVYLVTNISSGQKGAFKVFHDNKPDTITRLRFLVARSSELMSACPAICSPIDCATSNGLVGAYAPWVAGENLEDFLVNFKATFIECLQLAVAIAQALKALHELEFVHGDVHSGNVRVERQGSVLKVYIIDLDNFRCQGAPPPIMAGRKEYLAPELWKKLLKHEHAIPDVTTELYALGVMLHEVLLVKHPASGVDGDEGQFVKAMSTGWPHDPARMDRVRGNSDGLPAEILNPGLIQMFRRSLSPTPHERPRAGDWMAELFKALSLVNVCEKCGGPSIVDAPRSHCPICQKPPLLKLAGTFGHIPLRADSTVVGRTNLGGSLLVSTKHAIIRRQGDDYFLESLGQNGTFRRSNSWIRLPDNHPVVIRNGDELKFADVDARVLSL